jgi:hypothetical protein
MSEGKNEVMRKVFLFFLLTLAACGSDFEPDLSGWKATAIQARPGILFDLDGRERRLELPGGVGARYRYPQWTRERATLMLTQLTPADSCYNHQIVAIDTTGVILDTIYTAPPQTAINFKLAPNDSILVLKTYIDNCLEGRDYKYTFYNRFTKTAREDTVRVNNARGIPFEESVWSPDSKKVILSRWYGREVKAFVYDLTTKDTTNIEKGSNFVWSPTDNAIVAYIKDLSIYTMNIDTGEKKMIYEGKQKRAVTHFRWDPNGDFLMIHIRRYLLNIEAPMTQAPTVVYYSLTNQTESKVHHTEQQIHSWKRVE